jgi:hypothetical protein
MADTAGYAVGRGKPPVHSRFKKGQSGNPGGKPGPAKLARKRFAQLLHRALGKKSMSLACAEPETALEEMVNRLVIEASWGKPTPVRLVLSLLDAEIKESEAAEAIETECKQIGDETRAAENAAAQNGTAAVTLLQGKSQGKNEEHTEAVRASDSRPEAVSPPVVVAPPPAAPPVPNIRLGTPLVLPRRDE